MFVAFDSGIGALNKQRLDVSAGTADASGLFFPGALIVLRSKTCPGAKMLRGWEHGHIHADLTDDSDRRKGLDTRNRQNKIELW